MFAILGTPDKSKPLALRKRRRLPVIERPKSAPLSGEMIDSFSNNAKEENEDSVMDVCDLSSQQAAMKTVIKVWKIL